MMTGIPIENNLWTAYLLTIFFVVAGFAVYDVLYRRVPDRALVFFIPLASLAPVLQGYFLLNHGLPPLFLWPVATHALVGALLGFCIPYQRRVPTLCSIQIQGGSCRMKNTSQQYLNSEAHGYLMEAKACKLLLKDLERIRAKLKRHIEKEAADREAEFEAAMQYHSESDIQEAYGWEFISEQQYERYLELFRQGRKALDEHSPTVTELALSILNRIFQDIDRDCSQCEFEALSPEEQLAELKCAEESRQAWKQYIASLKEMVGSMTGKTNDHTASKNAATIHKEDTK